MPNIQLPRDIHAFAGIVLGPAKPIQIFVSSLTGNTKAFNIKTTTTIYELKNLYQENTGLPVYEQRFIYNSKELDDVETIGSVGMSDLSTIFMITLLRGGMYHESSGRQGLDLRRPITIVKLDQSEVSMYLEPFDTCESFIRRFLFNEHNNGVDISGYAEQQMHIDKELDKGFKSYLFGASKIHFTAA